MSATVPYKYVITVYVIASELKPYKYAGYPQLIKTIQMETKDEQLFSKSAPLLCAASELAYHTVHCSALNAEELRRENGLEVILWSHLCLKSFIVMLLGTFGSLY